MAIDNTSDKSPHYPPNPGNHAAANTERLLMLTRRRFLGMIGTGAVSAAVPISALAAIVAPQLTVDDVRRIVSVLGTTTGETAYYGILHPATVRDLADIGISLYSHQDYASRGNSKPLRRRVGPQSPRIGGQVSLVTARKDGHRSQRRWES